MRLPVVLHHGMMGVGQIGLGPLSVGSFMGIDRALTQAGYRVMPTTVHPTAGVRRRATQLKTQVLQGLGQLGHTGKCVIVAHSMGGLDARYMVTHLGMNDRVAAVVTISSPHRGSSYADWGLRNLTKFGAFRVFRALGLDMESVRDLTREACARFNEVTPDAPGVRYLSVSAALPRRKMAPFFLHSQRVIEREEGENDGLVSVRSAVYGEHLETWPADHFHVINKRFTLGRPAGDVKGRYARVLDRVFSGDSAPADAR